MEEIKLRFEVIVDIESGHVKLPERALYEFCYLQVRMICELISLSCLVAHGDITKSNKLTKTYQADRIVSGPIGAGVKIFRYEH